MAAILESAGRPRHGNPRSTAAGARFILILGASGLRRGQPCARKLSARIEVEIPGIAEQICAHGLTNTPAQPVPRGRRRDRARFPGGVISSPAAWWRARHPRGGHAPAARYLSTSSTSSADHHGNRRGLGLLVSVRGEARPPRRSPRSRRLECGDLAAAAAPGTPETNEAAAQSPQPRRCRKVSPASTQEHGTTREDERAASGDEPPQGDGRFD